MASASSNFLFNLHSILLSANSLIFNGICSDGNGSSDDDDDDDDEVFCLKYEGGTSYNIPNTLSIFLIVSKTFEAPNDPSLLSI